MFPARQNMYTFFPFRCTPVHYIWSLAGSDVCDETMFENYMEGILRQKSFFMVLSKQYSTQAVYYGTVHPFFYAVFFQIIQYFRPYLTSSFGLYCNYLLSDVLCPMLRIHYEITTSSLYMVVLNCFGYELGDSYVTLHGEDKCIL